MRTLTACLLATLLFAACEEEPPEPVAPTPEPEAPVVPAAPESIEGVDDLLGEWVITEQAGTAPEDRYFVTFTREGDYLVENEFGSTERRATFRPAAAGLIAITDSSGTRSFGYEVDGRTLILSVPGTETRTVLERRDGAR
jgi:hypothetical protein